MRPAREPLDTLERIRRTIGEYNLVGQYQQSAAAAWRPRNRFVVDSALEEAVKSEPVSEWGRIPC